jgi:malonate transporter MadM subunit
MNDVVRDDWHGWHEIVAPVFEGYPLVTALLVVGAIMAISNWLSRRLTRGRVHGSAIAILAGLVLAYAGGIATGGTQGLADVEWLSGVALLGGSMIRDLAIVATAFGVRLEVFRRTGLAGALSLALGIVVSFLVGAVVGWAFGYRDAVSLTTLGAGAATYIVGPVTGAALGASSEVVALSVAAGLVKSVLCMTLTPLVAPSIGLDNPRSAMIFGGLLGTTSGVAGGLAATDERLVPYGAMTATFFTGLGCLVGPSLAFFVIRSIVG